MANATGTEAAVPQGVSKDDGKSREEMRPVQLATNGVGALWQRDYLAVVEGSSMSAEAAVLLMRTDFARFSPGLLADFSRPDGGTGPLEEGDTMHINIRGAGHCAVITTLIEPRSFTFRTQEGHLEAGRITFGAERLPTGQLQLHIRSRSRIVDAVRNVLYLTVGRHAQTTIWVTFLKRLAEALGGTVAGEVQTTMEEVKELPADWGEVEKPTLKDPAIPVAA